MEWLKSRVGLSSKHTSSPGDKFNSERPSFHDCKFIKSGTISDYFDGLNKIGSGTFGQVYRGSTTPKAKEERGEDLPDSVAIKGVLKSKVSFTSVLKDEIRILRSIDSDVIPKYYGCLETVNSVYIISELVNGYTLYSATTSRASIPLSEKLFRKLFLVSLLSKILIGHCIISGLNIFNISSNSFFS